MSIVFLAEANPHLALCSETLYFLSGQPAATIVGDGGMGVPQRS